MPVSKEQISNTIVQYDIYPDADARFKPLLIQCGRYEKGDRSYYLSLYPSSDNAKAALINILLGIERTGLIARTKSEPRNDKAFPHEIEVIISGDRIAPMNQLDCLEKLLAAMVKNGLCAEQDATAIKNAEIADRKRKNSHAIS